MSKQNITLDITEKKDDVVEEVAEDVTEDVAEDVAEVIGCTTKKKK